MSHLANYLHILYPGQSQRLLKALENLTEQYLAVNYIQKTYQSYKCLNLYEVYPDGVIYDRNLPPLQNIALHIPHLKKLGVGAVHILPFLESPMVDKGYDVSDFYRIRRELGDFRDLKVLKNSADKADIALYMDLIINHVSEQHVWFKKAQTGQKKYRHFFIHSRTKPQFIEKIHKNSAVWGVYWVGGEKIEITIAFPEQVGEIPHWRQGQDGYWYYHTYYPSQLDLNWANPEVFKEIVKVMLHWASLGFHFRFDAIPFVGKSAYKITDQCHEFTHLLIAALKALAQRINTRVIFLIESYESIPQVIQYFGKPEQKQAELSYNFHLATKLWVSFIKQDVSDIWQVLARQSDIPAYADWLNFLRNHDELSLAYLTDEVITELQQKILPFGMDFREGYGISGRTFSLLGENERRFKMAYFFLASLPGGINIPYGDELAVKNIPLSELPLKLRQDSRNINRGVLFAEQFANRKAKKMLDFFAKLLQTRKQLAGFLEQWPSQLLAPPCLFACQYQQIQQRFTVFINLSNKPITTELYRHQQQLLYQVNEIKIHQNTLLLGPYAGVWLLQNS